MAFYFRPTENWAVVQKVGDTTLSTLQSLPLRDLLPHTLVRFQHSDCCGL